MKGIKIKIFRNHRAPLNSWAFPPVTWRMSRHFHGSKMLQVFQTKSSSQNMIQIMLGLARFSTSYPAAAAIRTRNAHINDWSHLRWSWYPSHGRSFPRRYSKFLLKMQHDAKRNHIPGEKKSILESALSSAIYKYYIYIYIIFPHACMGVAIPLLLWSCSCWRHHTSEKPDEHPPHEVQQSFQKGEAHQRCRRAVPHRVHNSWRSQGACVRTPTMVVPTHPTCCSQLGLIMPLNTVEHGSAEWILTRFFLQLKPPYNIIIHHNHHITVLYHHQTFMRSQMYGPWGPGKFRTLTQLPPFAVSTPRCSLRGCWHQWPLAGTCKFNRFDYIGDPPSLMLRVKSGQERNIKNQSRDRLKLW